MVSDKIEVIEKEIKKIETRLLNLEKDKESPQLDKDAQAATTFLLNNVIKDLRNQQKKLMESESSSWE